MKFEPIACFRSCRKRAVPGAPWGWANQDMTEDTMIHPCMPGCIVVNGTLWILAVLQVGPSVRQNMLTAIVGGQCCSDKGQFMPGFTYLLPCTVHSNVLGSECSYRFIGAEFRVSVCPK